MPVNIPDTFGVVAFHLRLAGDPEAMVTTLGGQFPDEDTLPNAYAQAIGNSWMAAGSAKTIPINEYTLEKVVVEIEGFGGTLIGQHAFNQAQTGGVSGGLPQNTAYLVQKNSTLAGRRGKGRMYIPGVNETVVDSKGVIQAAHLTNVNTALAVFLNLLVSDAEETFLPHILHSTPAGAPVIAPTPITSLTMDPIVATQRRRLR